MNEDIGFSIYQKGAVTKFVNNTDFNLMISIKPVKPKRKYHDVILVPPRSFKIFDREMELLLTKISFALELV